MPYALVMTDVGLLAGFADGEFWESTDRGGSWPACVVEDDVLTRLKRDVASRLDPKADPPPSQGGHGEAARGSL